MVSIAIEKLTPETKQLLLRFQQIQLRFEIGSAYEINEPEVIEEYVSLKEALKHCPEPDIASAGHKLDFSAALEELDRDGERRLESGELDPDDYQRDFDERMERRWQETKEIEADLVRLSLQIADVRPEWFRKPVN